MDSWSVRRNRKIFSSVSGCTPHRLSLWRHCRHRHRRTAPVRVTEAIQWSSVSLATCPPHGWMSFSRVSENDRPSLPSAACPARCSLRHRASIPSSALRRDPSTALTGGKRHSGGDVFTECHQGVTAQQSFLVNAKALSARPSARRLFRTRQECFLTAACHMNMDTGALAAGYDTERGTTATDLSQWR